MTYKDILFEVKDGVATITLDRPARRNVMEGADLARFEELLQSVERTPGLRVLVLTGAGEKAFSSGGDQSAHEGGYDGRGIIGLPIEDLQAIIRDVPKPVIAKVRGYAIGGGNVLALLCDLTIASESAVFGQVGPRVGSVDPGFGTAYMARVIGEKRAREVWYLCRRCSAHEALAMGMVNAVVPDDELDAEVARWCAEIMAKSPTALAIAKRSFNADSAAIAGIGNMGMHAVSLYYGTEESREGVKAFLEKRKPEFRKHLK